jgi:hypothetical protein
MRVSEVLQLLYHNSSASTDWSEAADNDDGSLPSQLAEQLWQGDADDVN